MTDESITIQNPDRGKCTRTFLDGSVWNAAELPSLLIGKGVYQPGWRWSEHAGKQSGKPSERHVGYIVSGSMMVKDASGSETPVGPGDAFEIGPGHDAWVLGDEPCVALDFQTRSS